MNIFAEARVVKRAARTVATPKPIPEYRPTGKFPEQKRRDNLENMRKRQEYNKKWDQEMIKDILDVISYQDGNYYVGGLAICHVVRIFQGKYGEDLITDLIKYADHSMIREAHDYLKIYIKYMKRHPKGGM